MLFSTFGIYKINKINLIIDLNLSLLEEILLKKKNSYLTCRDMSRIIELQKEILEVVFTNQDHDLYTETTQKPVLLIFLRHFGCMLCREVLADISKVADDIHKKGIKIVFVHMSEEHIAYKYLKRFELEHIERVSDPEMTLYAYFGLMRGTLTELYGLKVLPRMFRNTLKYGTRVSKKLGFTKQMPGVFLLQDGQIQNSFNYAHIAERPDYLHLTGNYRSD